MSGVAAGRSVGASEELPLTNETCTVEVTHDGPDWSAYLAGRSDATLLHDPRWGQVMREAYGNRPYYLTARRGGSVVGALQLVLQKSVLFGTHLSSLPYFDAAGILADDGVATAALLAEAERVRAECGAGWVELRHDGPLPDVATEDLPRRDDKLTLRLPLPESGEALWNAFKSKLRSQVRKAQKESVTTHRGDEVTVEEFHAVYCRNMRDLGSPPHSRRFFELLVEHFGDAAQFYAVRDDAGATLAASLTLTDALATRVPWAANDWRYRQSGANMLLYWTMLEVAADRGSSVFDFGRSSRDSGTHRFKLQWGSQEVPLSWHYVLPAGATLPELKADSPKYRAFVAMWRKLPVSLVRCLGPRLISKLS